MKRTVIRGLFMLTAMAVLAATPVLAAPAKVVNSKNKATKGTTQLKSLNGPAEVGTTYTLGKVTPININISSITYTVSPVVFGGNLLVPKGNEKVMKIDYTLHNPNKRNFDVYWSSVKFTAVDSNDKNHSYCQDFAKAEDGSKGVVPLLPGQKAKFYTAIIVPANGAIPKLIVESSDRLVLRYMLTEKNVKPLLPPVADPADKTGFTPLDNVPANVGEYYQLKVLTGKVDSIAFTDTPIKGVAPRKDNRYLTIIFSVRNDTPVKQSLQWSTFKMKLVDQDGIDVRGNDDVLYASRDEGIGRFNVEPKQEVRIRYFYQVPSNLPLKSLSIFEGSDGRRFVYDLSALK